MPHYEIPQLSPCYCLACSRDCWAVGWGAFAFPLFSMNKVNSFLQLQAFNKSSIFLNTCLWVCLTCNKNLHDFRSKFYKVLFSNFHSLLPKFLNEFCERHTWYKGPASSFINFEVQQYFPLRGSFTNYVNRILVYFHHLPTPINNQS